jgi:predicted aminopeptidase
VDLLSPKRWTFPIIGTIEYIGFFSRADAEAQLQQLADEGWDAVMYGVDAYSTLGSFPDPVQSRFLERSDGRIVETVIHELAHNTVYAAGQSTYNESLATFIGREGARLFFERRGAGADAILADLEAFYADQVQTTEWLLDLHDALVAHYAQDIPREEKIAGREAVFQAARDRFVAEVLPTLNQPERYAWYAEFPTNNAYVLLYRRYNLDLDVFQQVYEQSDDFRVFVAALQQAGRSPAPFAALREMADAE